MAYVLGMCSKKLNRWYKHILSGYREAKSTGKLRSGDVKIRGQNSKIRVPIVSLDHIGPHIAIDEKHIRGVYHTILSNGSSGKIIMMIRSMKSREIYACIRAHFSPEQMMSVRIVTKDGANCFDWVSRQAFPNAAKILDKWHVLKWAFEALQSVRVELKNQYVIQRYKEEQNLKRLYTKAKKDAKRQGMNVSRSDYKYVPEMLANGETVQEVLHRSRYLLYKYEDQWNREQVNRAQCLFDKYPKLEKVYIMILKFRTWYSKDNIGKSIGKIKGQLADWIKEIRTFNITSMSSLATTINRHAGQITNYFILGKTNAPAEALNRNIKRFIGVNYGIRELEYFYYRLNILNA